MEFILNHKECANNYCMEQKNWNTFQILNEKNWIEQLKGALCEKCTIELNNRPEENKGSENLLLLNRVKDHIKQIPI